MKVGKFIILLLFTSSCNNLSEIEYHGLFPVKEFGHWGFIDTNGKKIIECQFDEVQKFSDGLAAVRINKLWGFIDTLGKIVIKPTFLYAKPFSDNRALVEIKVNFITNTAFIKRNGEIAFICKYKNPESFSEGRARVEINDSISYIDTTGKVIIKTNNQFGSNCFYDDIDDVYSVIENQVKENDSSELVQNKFTKIFNLINQNRVELNECYSKFFIEGLLYIASKNAYINQNGLTVISNLNPDYYYHNFSDGLAMVIKRNDDIRTRFVERAGFIDKTGRLIIPMKYNVIEDFIEGRAAFRSRNKWGFLNKLGDTIIAPKFDEIDYNGFHNGLCRVNLNRAWGYINRMGNFVWKEDIDILYKEIDLTKWSTDTMVTKDKLVYGGKTIDQYNPLRELKKSNTGFTFGLYLDTSVITVYNDHFVAYKLFLANATDKTFKIPAQSGTIKIIQQALNDKNKWVDIEYEFNSFCGNEYHTLLLWPHTFVIFSAPITKGDYKTKLRFRLKLEDGNVIYSNEYCGNINKSQFIKNQRRIGNIAFTSLENKFY